MSIDDILMKYTNGEMDLEKTNQALKEAGTTYHLNPGKNALTEEEIRATTVGTYPDMANGWGLLDTGTGSLEDAINANTKALEKTNSALADMIRQAGALVLSDNMRLGSTVAASGTAQVVSAANSYHREGDTNITQNFYNGHDTAAAQQREARWEADKAKARKR